MDLLALSTFQAVVEEGGILAAARKLNTVQSNVTGRMRRLEDTLGTSLFLRQGRGLSLTPSGRVLLGYSQNLLALAREAQVAVRQAGESVGELRLGSMETFAALHLPAALKQLRQAHPGVELRVTTETSGHLLQQVLEHKLDCAFIAGPLDHPEIRFDEVVVEELVVVHAQGVDMRRLPLILFREGCAYRARALAWQRSSGHAVMEAMEFGTLEGIVGCVAVGLGWTVMPRRIVAQSPHRSDLVLQALPPEIARVPTGMITRRQSAPLVALTTLRRALLSQDGTDRAPASPAAV